MKPFMTENFLLQTETAIKLYHEYAVKMPIFDYHCHLPASQIAQDKRFENLTQAWLYEDHYKWRAMRINGVTERYCTGNATDWEKFQKWAETVPQTLCNPLYHWTHLELQRYFGINKLLSPDTAKDIYDTCSEMLRTPEFSVRNILRKMNVQVVCTTNDPVDSLENHKKIKSDDFEIKVLPTWRPDKGMAADNVEMFNQWINALEKIANVTIRNYKTYLDAIRNRHDFFHSIGCRISDHDLETVYSEDYSENEITVIFDKLRVNRTITKEEILKFKSAMMIEFALMNHEKGWAQQLHLGVMRNNNTRFMKMLGPDTGFDSIGDFEIARPLAKFLDRLDINNKLPRTIVYNINPRDNELIATMIGNFQDGSVPGKLQFGSAWWFLDQKDGMERQINVLSNMGLLSRFIGMLTDSRSFMSYPRHEYFRRILCNILGNKVENGELPGDMKLLGSIVEDICFNNAKNYFCINC